MSDSPAGRTDPRGAGRHRPRRLHRSPVAPATVPDVRALEDIASGPAECGNGRHERPPVELSDLECLMPDEVCGLLKVTKDWLYDAVQAGHVPAVRLHPRSRQLRFRARDLAALLDANYVPPGGASAREPAVEEPPAPTRLSPEVAARFGLA